MRTAVWFFYCTAPENVRDGRQTSQTKVATRNQTTVPLRSRSTTISLSTTEQGNWLQGRHQPDLSCQISVAQQHMPSPTVGQIRRANAWGSSSSKCCRFENDVFEHSTRRTQGGYTVGATDPSMGAGNVAPWSPLVWKSHKLKQGCTTTWCR